MSGKRWAVVVEVPMVGPQAEGIRVCLFCDHAFEAGDLWRKVIRLGRGGYAFGACNACWAERFDRGGNEDLEVVRICAETSVAAGNQVKAG